MTVGNLYSLVPNESKVIPKHGLVEYLYLGKNEHNQHLVEGLPYPMDDNYMLATFDIIKEDK